MTFTLLPNTAVGVGGLPSGTTMTALRDNTEEAAWFNHTWQDLTSSRSIGTAYQNTTGRQIMVSVSARNGASGTTVITLEVSPDNVTWRTVARGLAVSIDGAGGAAIIVNNGLYYRAQIPSLLLGSLIWAELR